MLVEFAVYAIGLPSLASGVLLLAAWRPWRPAPVRLGPDGEEQQNAGDHGASGVAVAVAYLISHIAFHGRPWVTALEAWEWLLLLTPLAALLGVIDSLAVGPVWLSRAMVTVLAVGTGWLLVPDFQGSPWGWRFGIAAAVVVLFLSQQAQCRRLPGYALPLSWGIIGAFGLPVMIASANAKFGLFSSAIAAGAGAAVVVWLWPRGLGMFRSAVPVVSVLFPSIFLSGYFNNYGDVPWASFLLLVIAPVTMWLGAFRLKGTAPTWRAAVLGTLAVASTCSAALALAWPAFSSAGLPRIFDG